ncbi:MAG TPA: redox-regulated ATPase YchF, partial [Firmicutes bacterium]|nr:redox-regulated ATPase YchF [Bacillota bacterium]
VEKRIAAISNKARINKDKESTYEMSLLEPLHEILLKGEPARLLNMKDEDFEFAFKNYHLLTLKPIIYVANVSDSDYMDLDNCKYLNEVKEIANKEGSQVIPISCEIEYELSSLSKEERMEYLQSLGANESGLDKVIKSVYKLLNLETFFTVGPDECRAWTFHKGMLAPQCAGIIHTDFEKGFIKAEIYSFDDLTKYGSELALKEAGKIRMEGKTYTMQDGDIAFFRFNV